MYGKIVSDVGTSCHSRCFQLGHIAFVGRRAFSSFCTVNLVARPGVEINFEFSSRRFTTPGYQRKPVLQMNYHVASGLFCISQDANNSVHGVFHTLSTDICFNFARPESRESSVTVVAESEPERLQCSQNGNTCLRPVPASRHLPKPVYEMRRTTMCVRV